MRELRKGPEYFYNQKERKAKIDEVLNNRGDLRKEIEITKKEIEKKENKEGVLENAAAFYTEVAEQFCQELKNQLNNVPQGKCEVIADGVIEKDILETFNVEDAFNP